MGVGLAHELFDPRGIELAHASQQGDEALPKPPEQMIVVTKLLHRFQQAVLLLVRNRPSGTAERAKPRHPHAFVLVRFSKQRHGLVDGEEVAKPVLLHVRGDIGRVRGVEREAVVAPDIDPIAVDLPGDLLPVFPSVDSVADRLEPRDQARVHDDALVDLRTVVEQQLVAHGRFRGIDLAVPVPRLHGLLRNQSDEDAGDDDQELAGILAPVAPACLLRRWLRHIEAPLEKRRVKDCGRFANQRGPADILDCRQSINRTKDFKNLTT